MMNWIFIFLIIGLSYTMEAQGIDTSYCQKIVFKTPFSVQSSNKQLAISSEPKRSENFQSPPNVKFQLATIVAFDPNALPFFCKMEYKMGLQAKMPIKIRLGDPDKVDELENKGIYVPK